MDFIGVNLIGGGFNGHNFNRRMHNRRMRNRHKRNERMPNRRILIGVNVISALPMLMVSRLINFSNLADGKPGDGNPDRWFVVIERSRNVRHITVNPGQARITKHVVKICLCPTLIVCVCIFR